MEDRSDMREYPDSPIVGVGTIIFNNDNVLLILRGNPPAQGKWSIPGGRVKIGEKLKDAARREVLEECCIEVEIGEVVEVVERVFRDEDNRVKYHYVLIDFAGRYISGELRYSSDAQDARWIPIDELHNYSTTEGLAKVIEKARKLQYGSRML